MICVYFIKPCREELGEKSTAHNNDYQYDRKVIENKTMGKDGMWSQNLGKKISVMDSVHKSIIITQSTLFFRIKCIFCVSIYISHCTVSFLVPKINQKELKEDIKAGHTGCYYP